ncbi:hypothetical protein MHBO_002564 [Bonamia ostreae]|uniref:Protein kinase domain-containing protein n=1 Tax=Bonamia ostreae TaxID=126728 RepID=A0ABV2AN81_9EUKA
MMALGLDYLHKEQKYIHYDFKLENILLASDEKIRICDFGLSRRAGPNRSVDYKDVRTLRNIYTAQCAKPPELLYGSVLLYSFDTWGLGMVILSMCCGNIPDVMTSYTQYIDDIDHYLLEYFRRNASNENMSALYPLLIKLFEMNPVKRLCGQISNHLTQDPLIKKWIAKIKSGKDLNEKETFMLEY